MQLEPILRGFWTLLDNCCVLQTSIWLWWNGLRSAGGGLPHQILMLLNPRVPQSMYVRIENLVEYTPTSDIPVLSQNDANSNCLERSPNASLMSLMLWLLGDKSLTNLLSEKLMLSKVLRISARSAPRWGVPRNAMAIVFCVIWWYRSVLYAVINAYRKISSDSRNDASTFLMTSPPMLWATKTVCA